MKTENLQLHDTVVGADIQHLATKLVGEIGDGFQMLVLVSQCLAGNQLARVEVLAILQLGEASRSPFLRPLRAVRLARRDLPMVSQQLLKVFRAEDIDLGEQQLALDERGRGVVQHGPDGDQVLQLTAGLLDDAVLAREHDGHAGEVLDLGVADDEGVDIEAASSEDAGHAGQHAGLVLHEAVEHMALGRGVRGQGRLVQDVGDGSLGGPGRRSIGGGQRRDPAMQGFVCQCGGRRGG